MKPAPIPKIPRSWKRERIEATHVVYNADDIPRFGCGWRPVRLELEGRKWATIVECGTNTRTRVALDLWHTLVKRGRAVAS